MLSVGLTGGIGAGKSICCAIFKFLGVPVYESDVEAKRLMIEDPELKKSIISTFGRDSYMEDGSLNRAYLANTIFNNEPLLKKMNSLVHPAVRRDFVRWVGDHIEYPYIIQESALIFEIGLDKFYDRVIIVYAEKEVRIDRVMKRDGVDKNAVVARMDKQGDQEEHAAKADFVIYNNGDKSLINQVNEIHRALISISNSKD